VSGACLGAVAAALVDGELDHNARERAQRHLAHCTTCRAEVEAHRSLKARLARLNLDAPAPDRALTDRLLALSALGSDRLATGPAGPARPVTLRSPAGPGRSRSLGPSRSRTRSQRRSGGLRRRTAAGSAVAVLGVLALALGGPQGSSTTPVDPATDSFVVQHVDTTSEVPGVVRAGLTGGGARSSR